jgi:ectonucleotide pyrophosphatase/phosphodiesterase family member 5
VAALSRRTFLQGTAAGGLALAWTAGGVWARPAAAADGPVRVYQVVVDGLRPDEVGRMPTLARLAAEGTYYPQARAHMVAETTTNHLSMLTGLYPDRHGMPGNSVPRLAPRVSDDRRYVKADSILTIARRQAPELRTATIGSKTYVAELAKHDRTGDGEQDASRTNTPVTAVPVVDAALDEETGTEAWLISRELDPDLLFLNLGMVDRAGHVDETGGVAERFPVLRQAALQSADLQLRRLVDELQRSDRWERTVFLVTADHSMDWSLRDHALNLAPVFEADDLLAGEVVAADNGGACLYALRCPEDLRAPERLARMRELALATEGVDEALYLRPNPRDGGETHWLGRVHPTWRLGELGGDLLVTVAPGWRIGHSTSMPAVFANPIPGNHGHPVTLPIPFVVAGGYAGIVQQVVEAPAEVAADAEHPALARNIDLAPTAAWLLGLQPPPGGFDGRVLAEAFRTRPSPRVEARNVASVPTIARLVDDEPLAASAELARQTAPAGSDEVVLVAADAPVAGLVAAPLAVARRAPLLLTDPSLLAEVTALELDRLDPSVVTVVGTEVADAVLDALRARGSEVRRLAADDVTSTAAAVARELGVDADDRRVVLLGPGGAPPAGFPATVLAGANHPADPAEAGHADAEGGLFGPRPVLLTDRDRVPAATLEVLEELDVHRVTVAASAEEVRPAVLAVLRDRVPLVERLGGDDDAGGRWHTAVETIDRAIAEGAFVDDLYLVGTDAVGASAAVLAAIRGGSVVPVPARRSIPAPIRDLLHDRADEFVRVLVAAGPSAISQRQVDELAELLLARRTRHAPDEPEPARTRPRPAQAATAVLGTPADDDRSVVPDEDRSATVPARRDAGPMLPATGAGLAAPLGAAAMLAAAALRRRGGTRT